MPCGDQNYYEGSEIAALKHDIERRIKIANDLATENTKLRAALDELLSNIWESDGTDPDYYADYQAVEKARKALKD